MREWLTMTTIAPPSIPAPPPAPRRRRFSIRRAIGVLLLLAGLGVLGYGAWQYWGTNIVAKQHHAEEKRLIADAWGQGKDGNAIGLLRVPRFGKDYEVPIVRGFDDKALADHYAALAPGLYAYAAPLAGALLVVVIGKLGARRRPAAVRTQPVDLVRRDNDNDKEQQG